NEALSIIIAKNLPSYITDRLVVPPFTYREEIILLVGGDEEEVLHHKVIYINDKMAEFIEKEYGCSIISGASQLFNRFKYMRSAYNECREALRNTGSLKNNQQAITFFEDFAVNTGIISGYDYMIEKSLINAVNNGEAEEAAQQIDKFVNSLDNREITFHDRNYFLHRIIDSVLAVLTDAGLSLNQIFSEKTDDSFWQISSIYESDKLKQYLNTQIVQPVIEALKQYRYNSSSDILKNVIDIVKETKGDITLAECAERLNYHPSYIWKVLKSERNMTFTDLTNSEKLETAKHMLLHTDYTVAEIADQLNYSNTQNFIRFFSKFEQTTPGKYRKENRKQ
ncbi:MAG: helix-turn-helix transcriptional regulator, partial [Clostridiales bacterium]|nr:helix-turn-helix transcriptional regulator [Clostridiales bacterium]